MAMDKLRVLSLFSGVGAFEKSLTNLGVDYEMIGTSEWDVNAIISYDAIHTNDGVDYSKDMSKIDILKELEGYTFTTDGKKPCDKSKIKLDKLRQLYNANKRSKNLGSITDINETKIPEFDLMSWGFCCQDLSVAGKQKGFIDEEGNKTRSGLYYDGIRILKHNKPKYSIIENVKALTQKKFANEFESILSDLEEAGYNNYYKVLNSKSYGVSQNRERIYIISIRKDIDDKQFTFPLPFDNGLRLKDFLENNVDEKYYISKDKTDKLLEQLKEGKKGHTPNFKGEPLVTSALSSREHRASGWKDISGTLCARDYKDPKVVCVGLESNSPQLEPNVLSPKRTEYGKQIRKEYEAGLIDEKIGNMRTFEPRTDGISNTLTTVLKDNLLCVPNECECVGRIDVKGHDYIKRVYSADGISPTIPTVCGGGHEPKILEDFYANRDIREYENECPTLRADRQGLKVLEDNNIIKIDIPQLVKVRKYPVDIESLKILLKTHKKESKLSNKDISDKLNVPKTLVEHWFRSDNCFSIPDAELWIELKELLHITTNEFDMSITEFEEKIGVYEKAERCDHENGIAPCLTSTGADEKIITNELQFVGGIQTGDMWIDDGKELSRNYRSGNRVYDSEGIAVTQTSEGGGLAGYTGMYKVEEPIKPELVGGIGEINFGKQYRQGNRVYDSDKIAMCLLAQPVGNAGGNSYLYKVEDTNNLIKCGNIYPSGGQAGNVFDENGVCPTLVTHTGGGGKEPIVMMNNSDQQTIDNISDKYQFAKDKCQEYYDKHGKLPEMFQPYNQAEITDVAPTLTVSCDRSCSSATVLLKQPDYRIRKLTPRECFLLQGFSSSDFDKCKNAGISDSANYKSAGNSITNTVLMALFGELFKVEYMSKIKDIRSFYNNKNNNN